MLIGRDHFQALRFNPGYKVCGEDVELCLALRRKLKLNVVYCPRFSGEHKGEATRSNENGHANSEDLTHIRGYMSDSLKPLMITAANRACSQRDRSRYTALNDFGERNIIAANMTRIGRIRTMLFNSRV